MFGQAMGMAVVQLKLGIVSIEFLPGRALEPMLCAHLVETFEGRVLFKPGDVFALTLTHGGRDHRIDYAKRLLQTAWDYVRTSASSH